MTVISGFGLEATLPSGWYGEVFRIHNGLADTGPVLHAATTPTVLADSSWYAVGARETMRADDVIVCLVNLVSLPNLLTGPSVIKQGAKDVWRISDGLGVPFNGVDNWHSSLRKLISVGERLFDLIAFFGTASPSASAVAAADELVGTIQVSSTPPVAGDQIEQFFSVAAAVQIQNDVGRQMWARDAPVATDQERAEHAAAFPNG